MPFKAIVTGDREAMSKFSNKDIELIAMVTHTGMTVDEFPPIVKQWMAKAKHPRFDKPYSQMVYQPMLEVMNICAITAIGLISSPQAATISSVPPCTTRPKREK